MLEDVKGPFCHILDWPEKVEQGFSIKGQNSQNFISEIKKDFCNFKIILQR